MPPTAPLPNAHNGPSDVIPPNARTVGMPPNVHGAFGPR